MQHRTRIELSQLKNEKARELYSKKLTSNTTKIEPTENVEEHAKKIETAIKTVAETTISVRRSAKKLGIFEDTLKPVDEKRTLTQTKNTSLQKDQQYKDPCKKVKKSARQDKERWIQQH